MSAGEGGVPDLLRRFVPVPYRTSVEIGNIHLDLQSNDGGLLAAMQWAFRTPTNGRPATSWFMKVIRDDDAPSGDSELTVLSAWPVTTLLLGTGTILAIDCERRQVLGFMAASLSDRQFVNELLPIVLEILRRAGERSLPTQSGDSA
jgi:hypothetical protein